MENFITAAWNAAANAALPLTLTTNGRHDWTIMNVNRPVDNSAEVWLKYCGQTKEFWGRLEALVSLEKDSEDSDSWIVIETSLNRAIEFLQKK